MSMEPVSGRRPVNSSMRSTSLAPSSTPRRWMPTKANSSSDGTCSMISWAIRVSVRLKRSPSSRTLVVTPSTRPGASSDSPASSRRSPWSFMRAILTGGSIARVAALAEAKSAEGKFRGLAVQLTGSVAVEQPADLRSQEHHPRRRQGLVTLCEHAMRRPRLTRAGYQEENPPRLPEGGQSQGQPAVGPVLLGRHDPSFALIQGGRAGKERSGVAVLAHAVQGDVQGELLSPAQTAQNLLIAGSPLFGIELTGHAVDSGEGTVEQTGPGCHSIVAIGMIRGHATFVTPDQMHGFPRHESLVRSRGEDAEEVPGGAAAAEGEDRAPLALNICPQPFGEGLGRGARHRFGVR